MEKRSLKSTSQETDQHVIRLLASRIRFIVSDVDGVWTDGGMYYSSSGEEMKRFNTRDGYGLEILRKAGLDAALVSREDSAIMKARARKLNVQHVFAGVQDKGKCVRDLLRAQGLAPKEVAYIGDDLNDLPGMAECGFRVAVRDASTEVKQFAQYVCQSVGGAGAFRELVDLIIAAREPQ